MAGGRGRDSGAAFNFNKMSLLLVGLSLPPHSDAPDETLKRPPPWLLTRPDCATAGGDAGSDVDGRRSHDGAARTPDATSTTRRTLLELMAKMHFAEHTLFTLSDWWWWGKCGKLSGQRRVFSLCGGGIHVRVIQNGR